MARSTVKLTSNFSRLAAEARPRAQRLVVETAERVAATARALAPVDTGELRDSIEAHSEGDLTAVVEVGAEHGIYQEYGTSKMAAQPFLTPAVEQERPRFEAEAKRLING